MQTKQQLIDQAKKSFFTLWAYHFAGRQLVANPLPARHDISEYRKFFESLLVDAVESAYDKGREDAASDFKAHLIRSDLTAAEVVTLTPEKYRA